MDENKSEEFNKRFLAAVDARRIQFDTVDLPQSQEDYRLHLTCIQNLIGAFEKKSLITPDPYKKDKKISGIVCPEDSDFTENEKSVVLGIRLSDYETMIDFICNYMKFSTTNLDAEQIQKLIMLNNTIAWGNLTQNSNKPNTRGLAALLNSAKLGAQPLTLSMLNDSVAKAKLSIDRINEVLKKLQDFQKQIYKADLRSVILDNPNFNKTKAYSSPAEFMAEIKKVYSTGILKKPFSPELAEEIVLEEIGADKDVRRAKVLQAIGTEKKVEKKQVEVVDSHAMLMDAVKALSVISETLDIFVEKISNNHEVLESEETSLGIKIARFFRKIFGMKEPPVFYEVIVSDHTSDAKHREKINYNQFITDLAKKSKYFASFGTPRTPGFNKISALKDNEIIEFINKNLADIVKYQHQITALDIFFKNEASPLNKQRIKGLKMELTTLKNQIVKTNQRRAEYQAYVEEQLQLKRLGITDNE